MPLIIFTGKRKYQIKYAKSKQIINMLHEGKRFKPGRYVDILHMNMYR